jgi:cell filamentation protein
MSLSTAKSVTQHRTRPSFLRACHPTEFLVIHPFREGNARTIKLLTDLLAVQTGRPLLIYDQSEEGQAAYIAAATAAFKINYAPMVNIIRQALKLAQTSR